MSYRNRNEIRPLTHTKPGRTEPIKVVKNPNQRGTSSDLLPPSALEGMKSYETMRKIKMMPANLLLAACTKKKVEPLPDYSFLRRQAPAVASVARPKVPYTCDRCLFIFKGLKKENLGIDHPEKVPLLEIGEKIQPQTDEEIHSLTGIEKCLAKGIAISQNPIVLIMARVHMITVNPSAVTVSVAPRALKSAEKKPATEGFILSGIKLICEPAQLTDMLRFSYEISYPLKSLAEIFGSEGFDRPSGQLVTSHKERFSASKGTLSFEEVVSLQGQLCRGNLGKPNLVRVLTFQTILLSGKAFCRFPLQKPVEPQDSGPPEHYRSRRV